MASRVLWRRSVTALGIYGSALLGFAATIVAARELSKADFGRFALVFGTMLLLQQFVDLTIDEVVVKYGNRYAARADWGRFHRLFRIGMLVKLAGGAAGTVAVAVAAVLAPWIWSTSGLRTPMLIASLVPLIQQPEGMAGAVLLLRNRYDLRGVFLFWAMALRLGAIVIGAPHGLDWLFAAIVIAQAISTLSVGAVAWVAYRRYPHAAPVPLGDDRAAIRTFAIQSSAASGLASFRSYLPTILVGIVTPLKQVAYFRAAQAPQTAFQSLSAPARLVLLAEQTRDVEHGRLARAQALLRRYIGATTVLAVAVAPPLWIWMPEIVRFLYGNDGRYVPATNAFRVMLLAACVQLVFGWTKTYPVSIGRPGLRTTGQVLEIAALVPGVLLLGHLYGATGACGGVLAGALVLAAFWVGGLWWLRGRPLPGIVEPAA